MYKSSFIIIFASIFLWGCPQTEPEPEQDNRVPLPEYGITTQFSDTVYSPSLKDHILTNPPKCGEQPLVHQNIKFSVQPATAMEAPNGQKCTNVHNYWGYFFVGAGSAFVADVSYYSGIKRVSLSVSHYCSGATNPIAVFLYDLEGNLIESNEVPGSAKSGWQDLTFDKNLSNLK